MEEINLKDIIRILLKEKWIILITTMVSLAIAVLLYISIPASYTTAASILANPIFNKIEDSSDFTSQFSLPEMDISFYQQQFLNKNTLQKTIEELNIVDKNGNYVHSSQLVSMVAVTNPNDTNILDVAVSGGDAYLITQIANTLCRHFIDYITELYQSSAGVSAKALAGQIKIEEKELEDASIRLRDYLISSENIDVLNAEIGSLITQITEFKRLLNSIELSIESNSKTVSQLSERVAESSSSAGNLRLDLNAAGGHQIQVEPIGQDLEESLFTLKLVEAETRLIENINDKNALATKISMLEQRLSVLQGTQAEEAHKRDAMQRGFDMALSSYEAYTNMYRQTLILEAVSLGAVNIKIISEAVEPVSPDNKNVITFIGMAVMLGIIFGMFIAFFKNFWNDIKS